MLVRQAIFANMLLADTRSYLLGLMNTDGTQQALASHRLEDDGDIGKDSEARILTNEIERSEARFDG